MKLKFRATIRKDGTSYVITIPMSYVKFEQLKENNVYEFVVDTNPIYNRKGEGK